MYSGSDKKKQDGSEKKKGRLHKNTGVLNALDVRAAHR